MSFDIWKSEASGSTGLPAQLHVPRLSVLSELTGGGWNLSTCRVFLLEVQLTACLGGGFCWKGEFLTYILAIKQTFFHLHTCHQCCV